MSLAGARLRLGISISAAVIVCLLINSDCRRRRESWRQSTSLAPGAATKSSAQFDAAARRPTLLAYGDLPQRFEANRGQTHRSVKFISRGKGFTTFLTENEAVIWLRKNVLQTEERGGGGIEAQESKEARGQADEEAKPGRDPHSAFLRMRLVNANSRPLIEGRDEQPGRSNYFIGGDSRRWITNVPAYSKVSYKQVWPGVDLV